MFIRQRLGYMNTVTYYPYAFPTSAWLRLAAFCWDKVYTIRPVPFSLKFHAQTLCAPPELLDLDDSVGGILHVEAESDTMELIMIPENCGPISQEAQRTQDDQWLNPERLLDYYSDADFGKNMIANLIWRRREYYEQGRFPLNGHDRFKISTQYVEHHLARNLAHESDTTMKTEFQDSIRLKRHAQREQYREYMHCLTLLAHKAAAAASQSSRDLATDTHQFASMMTPHNGSLQGDVAQGVMQFFLPKNYTTIDPLRIAEFRSESGPQRLRYQKEIQSVVREFAEVASERELQSLTSKIIDIAKDRVEETHKTFRRARLDTVVKSFGLTVTPPAIMTSVASALEIGLIAPVSIAAAMSLFAAARLIELDKAAMERRKSPWSYVLDAARAVK